MDVSLNDLTQALSKNFSFYHLGEIAQSCGGQPVRDPLPSLQDEGRAAIGFTLRGDLQAALVLLVDQDQDFSLYSEAGNILASQLVTVLADQHEIDVLLSPPLRLQDAQLRLLQISSTSVTRLAYVHRYGEKQITIETLLFVHTPGTVSQGPLQPHPQTEPSADLKKEV